MYGIKQTSWTDPFFEEGQEAYCEGTDREDNPWDEGTDGQCGWFKGWDNEYNKDLGENMKEANIETDQKNKEEVIKNIVVDGNNISFECDSKIRNQFFLDGLQVMADEHFGSRKVVVIPCDSPVGKMVTEERSGKTELFEIGEDFANECINIAFNHHFRIFLSELETKYNLEHPEIKKV